MVGLGNKFENKEISKEQKEWGVVCHKEGRLKV